MSKKKHAREADEKGVHDQPAEEVVLSADAMPTEQIDLRKGLASTINVRDMEPAPAQDVKPPAKEWVQAYLAYVLMGILGFTILVHYVTTIVIWYHTARAEDFEQHYKSIGQIFNTLLPILSGLVSSAITYYFTREIQSSRQEPNQPK